MFSRLSADEVLELKQPWHEPQFTKFTHKVINAVKNGERPAFSANNALLAPPRYVELMQKCWVEAANERPDFSTVLYRLQDMHRDSLAAAVDKVAAGMNSVWLELVDTSDGVLSKMRCRRSQSLTTFKVSSPMQGDLLISDDLSRQPHSQ